jgi:catechol 2,3-dioxygenase-like lactoylglutathione lyase family enzyme
MVIVRIDHVQLAMPIGGEETATAFYADLLDMARIPKPAALAARGGCWFESGRAQVHLGVEDDFRPALKAHPALEVDDLDALVDRLARAGVPTTPGEPLDGVTRVHVDDPFGNRIELVQHIGRRGAVTRFMMLMHGDATRPEVMSDWEPYLDELRRRGFLAGGSSLGPGSTLRLAETAPPATDHLVGYVLIDAADLDEARTCVQGNPVYEAGGTVEIKPLIED